MNEKRPIPAAALWALFAALALVVTWPMLADVYRWGVHDWPQFYTYYGVPRRAVVEYHELPGWNPHFYGGSIQWGHPDDPTVSPLFILILLFGEVAGPKIAIVVALACGMYSMWLLARHLGCGAAGSLLACVVWGLNGWHAFHFAVGHCDHITFLFQPLAVYLFLKAVGRPAYAALCGAVVALMYLCGGPYPFVFTSILLVVLSFFLCGARNSAAPFAAVAITLLFAAGFAMVKLLATIEFSLFANSSPSDPSGTPLFIVWDALFDPALGMPTKFAGLKWGGWEYAAFIGFVPGAFFVLGALADWRKSWPWVACGGLFLITALGSASPVNFFSLFTAPPGLSGMHVPFRFIVHFLLVVALVGAMGLDLLWRRLSEIRWRAAAVALALSAVFISAANLIWMHYNRPVSLYALASFLPYKDGRVSPYKPYARRHYLQGTGRRYIPVTYPQTIEVYMTYLEGGRLPWGYDAVYPRRAARFPSDDKYRGEAFLANADLGEASLVTSTLSRYAVQYQAEADCPVVLNQNYLPGWKAAPAVGPAWDLGGLVAANVKAGRGEVVFTYRPACRLWGMVITLATIAMALYVSLVRGKRPTDSGKPQDPAP